MKKILTLMWIFTATVAHATPMYYVLETQVLNTYSDFSYNVGDLFTHTFRVDRDNGVYDADRNWYTYEMELLDGPLYQAARDPFVGGLIDESFARDIPAIPEYNIGASTQFFFSHDNIALELYTNNEYGDGFLLSQNLDELGDPAAYYINLSLRNVSVFSENPVAAPVPEPATMLLFSLGLAGLAGYKSKSRK